MGRDGVSRGDFFAKFPRNKSLCLVTFSARHVGLLLFPSCHRPKFAEEWCRVSSRRPQTPSQQSRDPMRSIQRDGTRVAVPVRSWRPQRCVVSSHKWSGGQPRGETRNSHGWERLTESHPSVSLSRL